MAFLFPPVGEAPLDGTEYGRQSGRWVPVAAAGGTVPEAPTDGHIYGRQNSGWTNTDDIYLTWVPYTGPPQSFTKADVTRDGDWTMVSNKATSDRPAPQPSGAELDLLPAWTPATSSAPATYTVYNEWTVNTAGWVDQYGVDILAQNTGASHVIMLRVNGVVKDTFTATPNTTGIYWHDITPIVVPSGAVLRVTLQISRSGSNSWYQQTGLFATPPVYCSLAQGVKDAGAAGTTAYGCHLLFTPGAASPDWDVVAYGGEAAGGGGGISEAPQDGFSYGRLNAAWAQVAPLASPTFTGTVTLPANNIINGPAATQRNLLFETAGSPRWGIFADNTAESGSNVGTNLDIVRYSDAGSQLDIPFYITRATGNVYIRGVVDGSNVAAGQVGEYVTANNLGAPISLANGTAAACCSISLTAGDWDVEGNVGYPTLVFGATNLQAYVNTSVATTGAGSEGYATMIGSNMGSGVSIPTGLRRFNLNVTTTIYLVAWGALAAGTNQAAGTIRARRVR
jgi:hypothetical protein